MKIHLILRTTLGERAVRSLLSSVDVTIGAHATEAVPQGQGNAASASGKHDLLSKVVPGTDLTNVLFAGEQTYTFWSVELPIPRPKARLQRPAVYFTASISLTRDALNGSRAAAKVMLESFEALQANVLESLNFDPAMRQATVHLPEDRLVKVVPTSGRDSTKTIRGVTKRAYPLLPALYTKNRYTTLQDAVLASLHLEASQLLPDTVTLEDVVFNVENAEVQRVTAQDEQKALAGGNEIVYLFRLLPDAAPPSKSNSAVTIKLSASVAIEQGNHAKVEMRWQSHVDFSQALVKPAYKWSRPLSASILQPPSARVSLQAAPRSRSPSRERSPIRSSGETGILFNFKAGAEAVRGENVRVAVHCVNCSDRPRRFALVMVPQKRQHARGRQRDSTLELADRVAKIFEAPVLERSQPPAILDRNADVRIGPLPPGAVYETSLSFTPTVAGHVDLGILRIVDLDTRQTIDVRGLPDINVKATDDG